MGKRFYVAGALCCAVFWGCSSDGDGESPSSNQGGSGGTSEPVGGSGGDAGGAVNPGGTGAEQEIAIQLDFDNWTGEESIFYLAKGSADAYDDHNTRVSIGGHDALAVHADSVDNNGYGYSVEVQFELDQQTDMSSEEFTISFDIYIPSETYDMGANVQWGFYETEGYTPIYSAWLSSSLERDTWVTISATIDTESGSVDYSGFDNNPADWVFDVVRIQTIVNGDGVEEGDPILFYLDNLVVVRGEGGSEQPDNPDANTVVYTMTVDGDEIPVQRAYQFDVPVNYAHFTHDGTPKEIVVASEEVIGDFTLSPQSRGIQAAVDEKTLSFTAEEAGYIVLQVADQERLFVLMDPPEENPPTLDDDNVVNVADEGVDNTGETESGEAIQSIIDTASGATANVVYFPAGTYLTEPLYLRDDVTLYLAEGATLVNSISVGDALTNPEGLAVIEGASRGFITMDGVTNAKLIGRGTIDAAGVRLQEAGRKMFALKIEDSSDCVVDGIIALDSAFWSTMVYRSDNISIQNYKVINNQLDGEWNETDGVDFNNSTNSTLTNAFLYTGDDCMAVKADDIPDNLEISGLADPTTGAYINVSQITHEGIVCFSGSAACKVGTKTFGETMSDISFRDIDVISANRGLVIDAVDTAEVTGTVFEDVRIEDVTGRLIDFNMDPEAITWRTNEGTATVSDTTVTNVVSNVDAQCRIQGYSADYTIDQTTFSNLVIAGNVISGVDDSNASFTINDSATNITFE